MAKFFRASLPRTIIACLAISTQTAIAQEYPVRQIICVVPTEAGGDGVTR